MLGSPRMSSSLTSRLHAESAAARAGAERRVEGELARLELGQRDAARRDSRSARRRAASRRSSCAHDLDDAVGELERRLERIGEAAAIFGANDQPVDDDRDAVVLLLVQLRRVRELDQLAVDVWRARSPACAPISNSSRNSPLRPRTSGASTSIRVPSGQREHGVGDLRRRSGAARARRSSGSAACRRARRAGAGSRRSR